MGTQSLSTTTQSLSTTTYIGITDLPDTVTYGNSTSRRYAYDAQYRLSAEYMGDTQTAAYTYDKLDRLIRYDDLASGICWEFSYDLIGRTTGVYASDGRYVGYQYDSFNRLVEMKEYVGGKVLETGYHYDDQSNHSYKTGLFRGIFLNGQRQLAYSYDDMSRRDKRVVMTAVPFVTEYTYYDGATSGTTSTVVKTLKNGSTTWEYAYDAVGNITSIKENGTVVESYGYDALNQLTTVVRGGDTYSYSYDTSGNITAVTKNGGSYKSYTYGDSNWKDLLKAYNGTAITYDAIGNPLTYRDGFTFTWSSGRQLATAAKGGNTYTYTYDASGLRTSKTVGNTTTQYYWLGDKLQAQKTGNDYLIFLYDESGVPYGLIHKYGSTEAKYYYEYNLQGDIIGIINDAGTRVVTYQYSAWGELLSISGSMATSIGAANPLRYRGYYYDNETGFYYLQSRYYDPITGRFINADSYLSTGQGVLGYNMFAYCINDPAGRKDTLGTFGIELRFDGDEDPFDDLWSNADGGYANAYNPIDAGYRYGVDLSIAARSSLTHGGIYNNGYVAYSVYVNPTGTSSSSAPATTPVSTPSIPQAAYDMKNYASSHNGAPPKGYKGGKVFQNDGRNGGQVLPASGSPYYEYDIYPHVPNTPRGAERIVIGTDGTSWYTNDHYKSFIYFQE